MSELELPAPEGPQVVLVELEPGFACLFGDAPDGVDIVDGPLIPDRVVSDIASVALTAAAGVNVAAQTAGTLGAFQGLVQLTPETLELLKTLTPLQSGGVNAGALVNSSHHFAGTVKWVPSKLAGAGAGAAALGPAVALVAVQLELAKITSLVQKNIHLTDDLLQTLRTERWAEVTGLLESMQKSIAEARHIGAVSDPIWQNVAGHEATLDKVRAEFTAKVSGHLAAIEGARMHQDRSEYLKHHGDAIVRDAQALIRGQSAWFTYQAIRAGHLYQRSETDPTAGALLEKVVADARCVHDRDLESAGVLLRQLNRHFAVLGELPSGRVPLPFGKNRRTPSEVRHAARVLSEQLMILGRPVDMDEPRVPSPLIALVEGDFPERLLRTLRWHLDPGEALVALADVRGQGWPVKEATYVAVTDARLLVADKDELLGHGEVAMTFPLDDIRYVRFAPPPTEGEKGRSRLDVVTPQVDIHVTFDQWASEAEHRDDVSRLAQLLRSHMNLPEAEVPVSPLDTAPAAGDER